jgi:hypothetical protein
MAEGTKYFAIMVRFDVALSVDNEAWSLHKAFALKAHEHMTVKEVVDQIKAHVQANSAKMIDGISIVWCFADGSKESSRLGILNDDEMIAAFQLMLQRNSEDYLMVFLKDSDK